MRKIWNKGHRIRASDKHLVFQYVALIFVSLMMSWQKP